MNAGKPGPPSKPLAGPLLLGILVLAALLGGVSTDISALQAMGARKRLFGFHPHPHQLVAPLFLHFGWLHWICNWVSLASLSWTLERWTRPSLVLYLFFVSGVSSILVSLKVYPQATSLGCSGAVFGFLGACLLHQWWPPQSSERWRWLLLSLVALGLAALPGLQIPVDHAAHLGGLVAGLLAYTAWRLGAGAMGLLGLGLLAWCAWETRSPRLPF